MKFDIFFSICQTEVDGIIPSEKEMFNNFFDQVILSDSLGIGTAWIAETHLSCQVQKENPGAVIPHFSGEIGLNTDVLQMAHIIFSKTKNINVGSAIRNIMCNGGPVAHAEAIRTFLALHSLDPNEKRILDLGFAAGRFPFSNIPYGIFPRNEFENEIWPVLKGKIFLQATEIFLRLLKGEKFSSHEIAPILIEEKSFRSESDWNNACLLYKKVFNQNIDNNKIEIPAFWFFEKIGVIPFDVNLEKLKLTIGAHWTEAHEWANKFLPVGVFNLSITPNSQIEKTHEKMKTIYNNSGGEWSRSNMPRTTLVFINDDQGVSIDERRARAKKAAQSANENYWKALQGTLDPEKVKLAVDNALVGTPEDIIEQAKEKFNKDDRLMLWFDFNNHDNENVKKSMKLFMEKVAPSLA